MKLFKGKLNPGSTYFNMNDDLDHHLLSFKFQISEGDVALEIMVSIYVRKRFAGDM